MGGGVKTVMAHGVISEMLIVATRCGGCRLKGNGGGSVADVHRLRRAPDAAPRGGGRPRAYMYPVFIFMIGAPDHVAF